MAVIEFTTNLESCFCATCGVQYAIPQKLKAELRESHRSFYCPNGHSQWFPDETEAEKLRKELKRKEQEISDLVIEKLKVQKDFMRLKKGTCPCCKRSFQNLKSHMETKHPELIK